MLSASKKAILSFLFVLLQLTYGDYIHGLAQMSHIACQSAKNTDRLDWSVKQELDTNPKWCILHSLNRHSCPLLVGIGGFSLSTCLSLRDNLDMS